MTYSDQAHECGPGGYCGSCPTPCFLRGGVNAFDKLAEALGDTDSIALGCARWDDPEAACDDCDGNYFCLANFDGEVE
jgi:hypothetical protein